MSSSAKIVLYKSKTLSDGNHPVMLRVTIDRKPKYYSIGNQFKCKEGQWNKKNNEFNKKFPNHEKANKEIFNELSKANGIFIDLKDVPNYNHHDFNKKYTRKTQRIYLLDYFKQIIERLENAGKAGNAEVYKTARNKFKDFFNDDESLELSNITSKELSLFIEKCSGKGLKPNSIGNYLRTLRALYKTAIREEGYEYYPFNNFDWSRLKNKTSKRAITKEDILKIINYKVEEGTSYFDVVMMFSFMYLAYGLNFSDLAKIKSSNIVKSDDILILEYNRSKGGKLYQIPLNSRAKLIVDYYQKKTDGSGYLFPVLHRDQHITEQQIKTRIKTALKKFNSDLQEIASSVEIEGKVTSYVARHSFASVLSRQGENIVTISEMLGHSDLSTTQIYLKELSYQEKIDAGDKLL